jgi:3-oxoacyl-[acyl-carrier protein] reductase
MEFKDKAAIITGAAAGIGHACALLLAQQGANIAIVDQTNEEQMIRLARTLKELGVRVSTFTADVTDNGKAGRIVNEVHSRLGRLDILINASSHLLNAPVADVIESDWERSLNHNLKGALNYIQAAARAFRQQKGGKIVSVAPVKPLRGASGMANTTVACAGLSALTQTTAAELGRFNINVNAVAPGLIEMPATAHLPAPTQEQALRETALGRLGTPADVAAVAVFLCSEQARHITGATVRVDGGQSL